MNRKIILRFSILECTIKNWLLKKYLLRVLVSNSQFLIARSLDKSQIKNLQKEILHTIIMLFII